MDKKSSNQNFIYNFLFLFSHKEVSITATYFFAAIDT